MSKSKSHRARARFVLRMDRAALAAQFPAAFQPQGNRKPKLPLKRDIHLDIAARGGLLGVSGHPVSAWRVRNALADYTAGRRYQECPARGGMRIDLDGKEVEPVSLEAMAHAQAKVEAMNKRRDEMRSAAE